MITRLIIALCLTATLATAREFPNVPLRACDWYGSESNVQAHHIIPAATCRALGLLELLNDPRNCAMLCADDHPIIGHLGNYGLQNTQLAQMIRLQQKRKQLKPMRNP